MTLCVAHREGEVAVVDCIRAVRPPFSPIVSLANSPLCSAMASCMLFGDRYAGEWPVERFRAHGVRYVASEKAKSQIYTEAIPLFSARRVGLLDHPKLAAQLIGLERRTARGGRDLIDHAPGPRTMILRTAFAAR